MSEPQTLRAPNPAETPVFVFGALRSGTTLMRLMVKNHSALDSPGEADFLFDHIQPAGKDPAGWRYDRPALESDRIFRAKEVPLPQNSDGSALAKAIVSQMATRVSGRMVLNVHRHAPRLAAIFPDAKIIHLLRDPRDVARSSIGMGWTGNSYYGVDHWIGTEAGWDDAQIPAENVLDVRFEELMSDLEPQLTRITDFLGLEFDPAMLKYYENSTYGPPDPGIAQKWRKKASAREIALIEGRIGSLLEARGYAPAGPPASPTAVEQLLLSSEHRLKRWRHNIRRYGPGLFFGHHAARAVGLSRLAGRLAQRQEAIRIQNLK